MQLGRFLPARSLALALGTSAPVLAQEAGGAALDNGW
jgi:hypothetical protein